MEDEDEDEEERWESSLRQQNAANDELCSENGRLRAEIERLRGEAAAASAADPEKPIALEPSDGAAEEELAEEEELLEAVSSAVWDVLAGWPGQALEEQATDEDSEAVGLPTAKLASGEDSDAGATTASEAPGVHGAEGRLVALVEAAVRTALREALESPEPQLSPAEETAVLVAEKIALREQVERQQERLEALEGQLHDEEGALLPLEKALAAAGAAGSGLLQDAGGALSAGLSAVLAPKAPRANVEPGAEYEVVGRKGAIVRREESLRSEQLAELPPGARLRVVSLSENYPRRVEIVAVQVGEEPPIVGWISASTQDGVLLIEPVQAEAAPVAAREEGESDEEPAQVTLSCAEWDCLLRDREASLQQIQALHGRLAETGRELLQSFEMRSVLGELQLALRRAEERRDCLREGAAMALEELSHAQLRRRSPPRPEASVPEISAPRPRTPSASSTASRPSHLPSLDWDRLSSERETTAAALSASLQRVACLEHEAAELLAEREALERRGRGEVQRLRAQLRRLASHATPAVEEPAPAACQGGEGLFQRCVEDLQGTVSGLRLELRRATASEVALRRSVEARSNALRSLLHRGATQGLSAMQCGPLKLPASQEAERRALVLAVEEQLHFNLLLRSERGAKAPKAP